MSRSPRVAVLGAGIMGSAAALFLARRGARVTLFDTASSPFAGASRWNEGKIHLGYLYAGDPSLETARKVLAGGLAFKDLTESLIGRPLDQAIASHNDTYLVHRDSVVGPDAMAGYIEAVASLAGSHPHAQRYLAPLAAVRPRRLTAAQLSADYDTSAIVAGFEVQERSVSTLWVADRFVEALYADPRVELAMQTRVLAVRRLADSADSNFAVDTEHGSAGEFDFVVNALWQGRLAVDAGMQRLTDSRWSHRYRLSIFLRTRQPVALRSAVIGTGPFGDIKNYTGRDFYLSWYPAGLIAEGSGVEPPPIPTLDAARREGILAEVFDSLGRINPGVRDLQAQSEDARLEGGWVYAVGQGSLADPKSTLHRRDRAGIHRSGSYFSVDTGKYSIAPWLAQDIASSICGD